MHYSKIDHKLSRMLRNLYIFDLPNCKLKIVKYSADVAYLDSANAD